MPAPTEVIVDAPRAPLPPADPNVVVPPSVIAAAKRAEAYYAPEPTPEPQPEPRAASPQPDPAPVAASSQPAPAAPDTLSPATPDDQVPPEQWQRRYASMKGRWDQRGQEITQLQEQMTLLGDELMRTQHLMQRPQAQPEPVAPLVTEQDVQAYGPDLLDVVARQARAAVAPELEALRAQNADLTRQAKDSGRRTVFQSLDEAVPEWREVDKSPRFKAWLRLPDVYSRVLRGKLLDAAMQAAEAPRVVAFFKGFLAEEAATGHSPQPHPDAQPELPLTPRTPAVPLEALAAPGRARPATGASQVPEDKPIITRDQISRFYADVRRKVYEGRQDEKDRIERMLETAQREGRIASPGGLHASLSK